MAEAGAGADAQALRHLLTDSPWDAQAVMDQVAREADALLGAGDEAGLLIDESGFAKKGTKSVGVARQWLGRYGKVDNGQVGVFGVLSAGALLAPIDARLYLPRKWTSDPARCRQAGVPPEHIVHRTKQELALDIVRRAVANGVRFRWVGADAGYGLVPEFLNGLDDMGQAYVVDVHKDQRVYLADPRPQVPPAKPGARGRRPARLRTDARAQRVDALAAGLPADAWQEVAVRDSTRGPLGVRAASLPVWTWDGCEPRARPRTLLVSVHGQSGDTKYSLANTDPAMPLEQIARRQCARFWVERAFEDAKSHSGMADYEVRMWRAWHHHMALVTVAMLFMLKTKAQTRESHPLLSCADVEGLLAQFLPRRRLSPEDVLRQMVLRHRRRQAAIDSTRRRHAQARGLPADG